MYGDFSRDSYDPNKRTARVLMQQGRPLLDADWNEQISALVATQRHVLRSIVGWHGTNDDGLKVAYDGADLKLKPGQYFVDGILVEASPATIKDHKAKAEVKAGLIYLDVWEDTISPCQDADILETALQGTDTGWRTQVKWAVRHTVELLEDPTSNSPPGTFSENNYFHVLRAAGGNSSSMMAVRSKIPRRVSDEVCGDGDDTHPTSHANRLYRVEVHKSGPPASTDNAGTALGSVATFKWSRCNGSDVYSIDGSVLTENTLRLDSKRFLSRTPLPNRCRVELLDGEGFSANKGRRLLLATPATKSGEWAVSPAVAIEDADATLLFASSEPSKTGYFIRRWDHDGLPLEPTKRVVDRATGNGNDRELTTPIIADDNAAVLVKDVWIPLEEGLAVKFLSDLRFEKKEYFSAGDYWLVRADSDGSVKILKTNRTAGPGDIDDPLVGAADPTLVDSVTNKPVSDWRRKISGKLEYARRLHHYAPLFPFTAKKDEVMSFSGDYRVTLPTPTKKYDLKLEGVTDPILPATSIVPLAHSEAPAPEKPAQPLSQAGLQMLRSLFSPNHDVARYVSARYLNYEPSSQAYRRFRAPLLISDILEPTLAQYQAKVERCMSLSGDERRQALEDAAADYALAAEFRKVTAADGARSLLA